MDVDGVRGKSGFDNLGTVVLNRIVLIYWVGTQMVVKGLDFESVDLVGILLDADSLLGFADFG